MTEYIEKYKEWLNTNKPEVASTTALKLDRYIADLNRLKKWQKRRAAVGIYGQSQSGKSFLVDAMLCNKELDFCIKGIDTPFREINPSNQAESTAVTCRFTKDGESLSVEGHFECELLSLGELFFVFLAGYVEFDHNQESLNKVIGSLKDYSLGSKGIKLDRAEIYELLYYISPNNKTQETLSNNEVRKLAYEKLEHGLADGLTIADVKNLAQIIFEPIEHFCQFVLETLELYEAVNMASTVYLPHSLLREFINTNSIYRWGDEQGQTIGFKYINNQLNVVKTGSHKIALLQIASSELILPVGGNSHDFLSKIDLLDFPGLRAFQDGEEKNHTPKGVAKAIKQGKLKSTFDLYSLRKVIPALIIASPWENQEAPILTKKIQIWLEEFCYPEYLRNANRFLFFVMTKSDNMLANSWEPNLQERIEARLVANYEIQFDAMFKKFGEEKFTNIFFTINPQFIQYKLEINELEKAKQEFLSNSLVEKHLGEIADVLFQTFENPAGGTARLNNALNQLTSELNNVKQLNINKSIDKLRAEIISDIDTFLHHEDDEEERNKRTQLHQEFANLIRNKAALRELIPYFYKSYPDDWEWKDEPESDVIDIDFENNTEAVNCFDEFSGQQEDSDKKNELSNLFDKYEQNLLNNLNKANLSYIYSIESENNVRNYLLACIHFFKHDEKFKKIISEFATIRSNLDSDSVVPKYQFREAIKHCIISHFTGFSYQDGVTEKDIFIKTATGLYNSSKKIFDIEMHYDRKANEELKTIKTKIIEYV